MTSSIESAISALTRALLIRMLRPVCVIVWLPCFKRVRLHPPGWPHRRGSAEQQACSNRYECREKKNRPIQMDSPSSKH